mmetsp:Transcript_15100/g.40497  ORF Transcript_15100/g.40497 Transcript_15100/m.40497 type:complete len:218 (+) Transcript_15100:232-885(+)
MSSMRRSMAAASTAVLIVWTLTSSGSQTPSCVMSASSPEFPFTPQVGFCLPACFARSAVSTRITLPPQFSARVRGMTSSASPTAPYGICATPCMLLAFCVSRWLMVISIAPPPGTSRGFRMMLRATHIASSRLRSTSFKTSLEPPRSTIVHAFGDAQSTMYEKYSSPILRTSKSPALVPTSDSFRSSGRLTIVAPVARAMRLLSVLRSRRMQDTFAF